MSLVLHLEDYMYREDRICNVCGKASFPPYLLWTAHNDIIICQECCARVRNGFMADLIQCAAIHEISRLMPGYLLVRSTRKKLEQEAQEQRRHEEEALNETNHFFQSMRKSRQARG